MKNILKLVVCVIALISASVCANALSFGDVLISGSYGTGSNTALCIVDFGTKSYAFEYKFDGQKNGEDMLLGLNFPNTELHVTDSNGFVTNLSFNNQAKRTTTGEWPGWNYYTSTDGTNWESSLVGCKGRYLENGSWDAWNYTGFDPESGNPTAPNPVTPIVPEPSAVVSLFSFIGLAASTKLLRFRSR